MGRSCSSMRSPTLRACSCNPSSRTTSSTAMPTAHDTVFPPKVLKYSIPLSNASAIARVVDHRADRMSVAERLAHHDDVGHDVLILERPEARAHASESRLHFVGDAQTAAVAHVLIHLRQISARQNELSADARTRLGDERREPPTASRERCRRSRRPARRTSRRPAGRRACTRRDSRRAAARRAPTPARPRRRARVLVRTDVDERRRVAVIRRLEHDHVRAARVRARQPQRELVRLARRVHEVADVERRRHRRQQSLGVLVEADRSGSACSC